MRSGRAGAFFLMTEREQDHIFLPLVGGLLFVYIFCLVHSFFLLRSGRAGRPFLPPERDEGNTSERAQWAMQRGFVGAAVKTGSGDSRARRFWVPQEVPRVPLWNPLLTDQRQHFRPLPAADKGRKWWAQRSASRSARQRTSGSRAPQEKVPLWKPSCTYRRR